MNFRSTAELAVVCCCLSIAAGCGGDSSKGDLVKGKVTLDGAPLAEGRIGMVPTDGIGAAAGAPIKDGKFELRIKPGPKLVEITATKVVGSIKPYPNDPNSPEYDRFEQYLPAKYNSQSELKCDVKAGTTNDLTFALEMPKSEPAKTEAP